MSNIENRRRTALLVVLVMSLVSGVAGAQTGPLMVTPSELMWVDAPPTLPGVKMAVIHGAPSKEGLYALQLKIPAGYKFAPHRHPVVEYATVISGTLYSAVGEQFDTEKGKALPAGSFFLVPAQTPHFAWTKEETIIQVHAIGRLLSRMSTRRTIQERSRAVISYWWRLSTSALLSSYGIRKAKQ